MGVQLLGKMLNFLSLLKIKILQKHIKLFLWTLIIPWYVLLIHSPHMERGKLNQFVMFSKEMIIWFSDLAFLVLFESHQWLRKTLIKGLLWVLLQLTIIHATLSKISIPRKSYQKSFLFEFPANRIKVVSFWYRTSFK